MSFHSFAHTFRKNNFLGVFYRKIPPFVQDIYFTAYGYLKLFEYKHVKKHYLPRVKFYSQMSQAEFLKFQRAKLLSIAKWAEQNSSYYRKLFKENNIKIEGNDFINEFSKIPLLSKELLIRNNHLIQIKNDHVTNSTSASTGGTTGASVTFTVDREYYYYREAQLHYYYELHGYNFAVDKAVMYRAGVISPKRNVRNWRVDYARKLLYLSSYYSGDKNFEEYFRKISEYKPKVFIFLPSAMYEFAQYLDRNNLQLNMEVGFSSSEMLHPFQRDLIQKVLNCKIWDHYGHVEPGNYVCGQCTFGNYHIPAMDVYCEISPNGELIETSLLNKSFPFLRYNIEDRVDSISYDSCECGSAFPYFKHVQGRTSECLITLDGNRIPSVGFDQIFRDEAVLEAQIVQRSVGYFDLYIVKSDTFDNPDTILSKLIDRIGSGNTVNVIYTQSIPKAANGKKILVKTELK